MIKYQPSVALHFLLGLNVDESECPGIASDLAQLTEIIGAVVTESDEPKQSAMIFAGQLMFTFFVYTLGLPEPIWLQRVCKNWAIYTLNEAGNPVSAAINAEGYLTLGFPYNDATEGTTFGIYMVCIPKTTIPINTSSEAT